MLAEGFTVWLRRAAPVLPPRDATQSLVVSRSSDGLSWQVGTSMDLVYTPYFIEACFEDLADALKPVFSSLSF